ncbi:PKD domain-containing protein [Mangrovimonas sp. AS39]|uniref:PKD domain-containing protein n=1 Tax=Mangrovimonas futianensis TaxID=2895523 RepID=UPI001E4189CE|nr:PKD domain-containing protein [Mangrovimonas futianensis]MCF1191841.1 PKD domain-containing protein [Mangrovimonas futianensis]MCF1195271.1 PKD domain-containing protein [Mangrovimonas futianensis]
MKKVVLIFVFAVLSFGCHKDDAEETIDCLFASVDFDVNHAIDSNNTSIVEFTITYTGVHALDNAKIWDFGDGTIQTLNGNTVSHTYLSSGSYTVKVKPTIRNGDAYCTPELTENVTIN